MFGTFLLFIIFVIASLGVIVGLGLAIFFLQKATQELNQPRELIEIIKHPTLFMSPEGFSEEGNQFRIWFLLTLSITFGLIILSLLMKLILS